MEMETNTTERRARPPPPPPTTLPQALVVSMSSVGATGRCDSPTNASMTTARDSPRSRDMKALSASVRTNIKLQEQFEGRSTPEPQQITRGPGSESNPISVNHIATNKDNNNITSSTDSFVSPIRFQPNRVPINTSLGGPSPRREGSPQIAPAAPLPEPSSPERSVEERRDHQHSKLHRPGGSRIESVVNRRVADPQFRRREPLPTHPLLPPLEPAASSRDSSEQRNGSLLYPALQPSREVSPDVKRPATNITTVRDSYAAAIEPTLRKAPLLPVEPISEPLVLSVLVKGNRSVLHPLAKPQVLELTINQDSHLVSPAVVVANVISLLQATADAFEAKDGTTPTASASPLREPSQPLNAQCRSVVFPVQIGRQLVATAAVLSQDDFRLPLDALVTSCSNVDRLYTLEVTFAMQLASPERHQEQEHTTLSRRVARETIREPLPNTFQDPTVMRFAQRLETVESYLKDLSNIKKGGESSAITPPATMSSAGGVAVFPTHPPPSPPPRHRIGDFDSHLPQPPRPFEDDLSLEESFAKLKKKMLLSPILNESREVAALDETSSDFGKGKTARELLGVEPVGGSAPKEPEEVVIGQHAPAVAAASPIAPMQSVMRDSYTVRAEKIEFLARNSRSERKEILLEARRVMEERIALVNWMEGHLDENLAGGEEGRSLGEMAPSDVLGPIAVGMAPPRLQDTQTSDMQLEYDSVLDIWRLKRKP